MRAKQEKFSQIMKQVDGRDRRHRQRRPHRQQEDREQDGAESEPGKEGEGGGDRGPDGGKEETDQESGIRNQEAEGATGAASIRVKSWL